MPKHTENAADTSNIDDVIAYLESPEYLRMVAWQQGESPDSLLRRSRTQPWQSAPRVPAQDESAPHGLSPITDPGDPTNAVLEWVEAAATTPVSALAPAPEPTPERRPVQLRTRDPWYTFQTVLSQREPFNTYGALKGRAKPVFRDAGYLTDKSPSADALWRADFSQIDYVVYSYYTPIAWHITGAAFTEWIYPDVRYSRTTSGHQTKIKTALLNTPGGDFVRTVREV